MPVHHHKTIEPGQLEYHWAIIAVLVCVFVGFYLLVMHILSSDNSDRTKKLIPRGKGEEKNR